jgi:hypothetical protein
MEAAREVDLSRTEEVRSRKRERRHGTGKSESRYEPISHLRDIGRAW